MEDDNTTDIEDSISPQPIQFALLLIVEVPAIICTIFILIYFFRNFYTMVTKALRNHAVLLLTIISLLYITLDLPFSMNSFRLGYDYPRSLSFCLYWYWIDYSLIVSSLFLTATASIQRHMLIFNTVFLHRSCVRLVLHYIPLVFCLLYPSIFYLVVIYFYPCENSSDDDIYHCVVPCYSSDTSLFNIDWMINTLSPVCVIVVTNVFLICRVIHSLGKFRRQKSLMLRRQRKLTMQLLAIASLYAIGWGPSTVVAVLQQFFLPDLLDDIPMLNYVYYLSYFVCPLQSFACLIMSPEMKKFLKVCIRRLLSRSTVVPEIIVRHAF